MPTDRPTEANTPCVRRFNRSVGRFTTVVVPIIMAGCRGPQSALEPAGRDAGRIADLFWWMTGAGLLIWIAVVVLAYAALRLRPEARNDRTARLLIIGGGAVFPSLVLTVLLVYGLAMLPPILAPAPEGSLKVAVSGEQWWWRVRYPASGGGTVETANEIRIPVGEPTEFILTSPDVIHAFWIPSLGGKIDMIPGRTNRLVLWPEKTGTYRGACAEYCGTSHAYMNFDVVVMEKPAYTAWLAGQAQAARAPVDPPAIRGRDLFLSNGCGACHTIRGTPADGPIGPDLTHVGSRMSLGAGLLGNEPRAYYRWIQQSEAIKPGVHMPHFGMLSGDDLRALATYLNGLE